MAHSTESTDEAAVRALLGRYQDALNASNTDRVMPLYAEDGIFMWEFHPSVIGHANLRRAYDEVFAAITLQVRFTVEEFVQMSPEWSFARTSSAGTQTVKASGRKSAEANQELFIFRKRSGGWKIARYCFSSINPPPRD
jgi:uncharacterized protein (TIGR02246 family)